MAGEMRDVKKKQRHEIMLFDAWIETAAADRALTWTDVEAARTEMEGDTTEMEVDNGSELKIAE